MQEQNGFFGGRYGADLLSAILIGFSAFLLTIILLTGGRFLCLLALIPVGWALFRILSRSISAREAENRAVIGFFLRIRTALRLTFCRVRDRKTHLYFRCACCGRMLRVRRGSGTITVSCPHCRTTSRLDTGAQNPTR